MKANKDKSYRCVFPDKFSNFKFIRSVGLKLRESIFSSLGRLMIKSKVLDLFSGCGSYAFCAIEKGASEVVIIEKDYNISLMVNFYIDKFRLSGLCKVYTVDVLTFLEHNVDIFDIIFIDPPYAMHLNSFFWKKLKNSASICSVIVLRIYKGNGICIGKDYVIFRDKVYSNSRLLFLKLRS